jgi:capsular polysaccharide transport system permease protein
MKLSPPTRPSEALTASPVSLPGRAAPPEAGGPQPMTLRPARRRRFGPLGWFLLLVLLPTALVGAYYAGYAADLYESEARFQIRGRGASSGGGAGGGIASLAGMAAMRSGADEAQAVKNFVDSHDAIAGLRRTLDLVGIWRRPEADMFARLWWEEPEAERLLRYYRSRVKLDYDMETGVSTLRVLAFRPGDAQTIAAELLRMSEELVNRFSLRSIEDQMRVARQDVANAEARVLAAREAITAFREREQALDPTRSAGAALETIGRLEASLSQARAELQERRAFMRPDNPQIQVLNNRIAALSAQIATERGRVTRGDEALTQQVAGFERLQLEREFADRQLASATASLEQARSDAQRQQIFLMRVAEPNMPEHALYPQGVFNTVTVLIALSVMFGIGWLLIAGAREHAS